MNWLVIDPVGHKEGFPNFLFVGFTFLADLRSGTHIQTRQSHELWPAPNSREFAFKYAAQKLEHFGLYPCIYIYIPAYNRAVCNNCNGVNPYAGGAGFESRPGYPLS
jgi:hypothetical protein